MKKFTSILLVTAFFVVTTFTSCEKRRVLNRLEGTWDVSSFIVDGDEYMGTFFDSFVMEYGEADDDEGSATWTVIDNIFGATDISTGVYVLDDDAEGMVITFTDGSDVDIVDADISDLDGDEITLTGFDDGDQFTIKASKR